MQFKDLTPPHQRKISDLAASVSSRGSKVSISAQRPVSEVEDVEAQIAELYGVLGTLVETLGEARADAEDAEAKR